MRRRMHDDCVASMIVLSMMGLPLLLLVLQCACHVTATVTHRLELETCIVSFDVKTDMIIRTNASQSMGGQFLDRADLGSREECLRLCCETDGCDVFVYDEKDNNTCYLFQCGPAQNFRCKFTYHANYTSAVLTPPQVVAVPPTLAPQHLAVVAPEQPMTPVAAAQNPRSQHEIELSSLMRKAIRTSAMQQTTHRPPAVLTTRTSATSSAINSKAAHSACGRFQFQCHSGECIAVYNACDGIPQCVDGSDEGPECPSTSVATVRPATGRLTPIVSNGAAAILAMQQQQQQQPPMMPQLMPPSQSVQQAQQPNFASPPYNSAVEIQPQPQQQQQHHNREDPMTAPIWPTIVQQQQQQQLQQQQQQQMMQSNVAELPNNSGSYGSASHIFNHKLAGLQLANNPIAQVQQSQAAAASNNQQLAQQFIAANSFQSPMIGGSGIYQLPPLQQAQPIYQPASKQSPAAPATSSQWPADSIAFAAPIAANPPPVLTPSIVGQQQLNAATADVADADNSSSGADDDDADNKNDNDDSDNENDNDNDADADESNDSAATTTTTASPPTPPQQPPPHPNGDHKNHHHKHHHKHGAKHGAAALANAAAIENNAPSADGKSASSSASSSAAAAAAATHKSTRVHGEQLRRLKNDLDMEFRDHDGLAERPGGAILSLTLGLIVTAALVMLCGCRANVVRRRRRHGGRGRGRGSLGKGDNGGDADFLVNGMYL